MLAAGIDVRNGALGKRACHRVDLLSLRIILTHAEHGEVMDDS